MAFCPLQGVCWACAGGIGGNGAARLEYFKKVVAVPSLSLTGGSLNFRGLGDGSAWLALITFLYVDFLDATGMHPCDYYQAAASPPPSPALDAQFQYSSSDHWLVLCESASLCATDGCLV